MDHESLFLSFSFTWETFGIFWTLHTNTDSWNYECVLTCDIKLLWKTRIYEINDNCLFCKRENKMKKKLMMIQGNIEKWTRIKDRKWEGKVTSGGELYN